MNGSSGHPGLAVEPDEGSAVEVGDPNRTEAGNDPGRAGANTDRLDRASSRAVDPRHRAVRGVSYPQRSIRDRDAVGQSSNGRGGNDTAGGIQPPDAVGLDDDGRG